MSKRISVGHIMVGGGNPLVLIAGPCVVEDREMILKTAQTIQKIARKLNIPLIFKSSYRKANRTSGSSFSGIGDDKALSILWDVKQELGLPILTDIHMPQEAQVAAQVADVLQIPAFLCRQTDLLQAAGKTGKVVNIKKGQFLSPAEMKLAAEKVESAGNKNILLTERGTTFGYNNLVVDMRSLSIMRATGYPVVLDATHSVQLPGGRSTGSGGQPEFIFPIARAGVAAGCDALFVETHPNPSKAWSDAESQLRIDLLEDLLKQVVAIDRTVKQVVS
ncbi:MAG: 3-deoxy-8-phosphooctulonate synthase [Ignavibacteriales bacterium]|nr:3-deoxy-8-phosphooctulonate synthase [Ignavibacteriales bacterium]